MKKFIHITLPTGHVYEIPTEPIAQSRAAFYHDKFKDTEFPTIESALEDTVGLFTDDNYSIRDWLLNNMDVDKLLAEHGRLARYNVPAKLDDLLNEAEWEYSDAAMMVPQLDSATILDMPLSLSVAAMVAQGNICQLTLLNDDAGKPFAGVIVITGGEQIINTFSGALVHLANSLTKAPDGVVQQ